MHAYAQINPAGLCIADSDLHSPVDLPDMIAVDPADRPYLGRLWDGRVWQDAPELPRIVITAVDAGEHTAQTRVAADFSVVDAPVGAVLTITAQLQWQGQPLRLSDTFRMPVTSTDGRERVVLASMEGGTITMRIALTESRVWQVTQATINRNLPADKHMAFAGLTVYVIEA